MSLAVFYVLVSVTSILLYVILFLWWTPPKLRLTMVGAMLAAFAASFLLAAWANRQAYELLPQAYHLLDGRLQSLISGLIGAVIRFGILVIPLLIPRIRATLNPENGVTLPLALALGASISQLISMVRLSISPEMLEQMAHVRPEWIALSVLFIPVQMIPRYALAVSFLSLTWPSIKKCVYTAVAGIFVLAFTIGTAFTDIVSLAVDGEVPTWGVPLYTTLYQVETFSMFGLTLLGLWMVDQTLRRRKPADVI